MRLVRGSGSISAVQIINIRPVDLCRAAGKADDHGPGIAITGDEQLYITGMFQDTLVLGENTLVSDGGWNFFIAKMRLQAEEMELVLLVYSSIFN